MTAIMDVVLGVLLLSLVDRLFVDFGVSFALFGAFLAFYPQVG